MAAKGFTPEELAILAAFDAEIDNDDELTPEERQAAADRDADIRYERLDNAYRQKLARVREYGRKHKKRIQQNNARRYQANREAYITKSQAYRAANLEKCKASQQAWYRRNKAKVNAKHRAYRAGHREELAERSKVYQRNYYDAHKEEIAAKRKARKEAAARAAEQETKAREASASPGRPPDPGPG